MLHALQHFPRSHLGSGAVDHICSTGLDVLVTSRLKADIPRCYDVPRFGWNIIADGARPFHKGKLCGSAGSIIP